MATVKEVKIQKDGAMVTPKVLADSIYNLDGTKFKDGMYTKEETYTRSEIDNKLSGKSNTGHTHDDRYYTETEIDSKVSEINTALGQKLKIGKFVTGRINLDQDNPTFVLPEMGVGELSVFDYYLVISNNTGSNLTTYIDVPSNGKYFTIFAELLLKEGASDLSSEDRRMEIYSIPGYVKNDRHITSLSCPWNGYTTCIHILVIRFE